MREVLFDRQKARTFHFYNMLLNAGYATVVLLPIYVMALLFTEIASYLLYPYFVVLILNAISYFQNWYITGNLRYWLAENKLGLC